MHASHCVHATALPSEMRLTFFAAAPVAGMVAAPDTGAAAADAAVPPHNASAMVFNHCLRVNRDVSYGCI